MNKIIGVVLVAYIAHLVASYGVAQKKVTVAKTMHVQALQAAMSAGE